MKVLLPVTVASFLVSQGLAQRIYATPSSTSTTSAPESTPSGYTECVSCESNILQMCLTDEWDDSMLMVRVSCIVPTQAVQKPLAISMTAVNGIVKPSPLLLAVVNHLRDIAIV